MKFYTFFTLIFSAFLFTNCKNEKPIIHYFGEFNPQNIANQTFKLKIGRDTVFKTHGGIILTFCKNTFIGEKGQEIEVIVKEVLTKKDIIKSGIPTIASDGRLLESGGMLNVLTNPLMPINKDCPIQVKVPSNNANMQLFVADVNNGESTWRLKSTLNQPQQGNLKLGEQLFIQNCSNCHNKNLKDPLTGPPLNCATKLRSREWLIKFTKNSQKMMAEADKQALCISKHYGGAVMSSFENLDVSEISAIYDYIESIRDKDCDCNAGLCNYYFNCTESDSSFLPNLKTNQPVQYQTSYYEFTIKDYEWINIDRFIDGESVGAFTVNFNTKDTLEVYMIFENRKSICPMVKENDNYIMLNGVGKDKANLPKRESVKIVAFTKVKNKEKNKVRQFGEESFIIEEENHHTLKLDTYSEDDFRKMIKEYGFVQSCCNVQLRSQ